MKIPEITTSNKNEKAFSPLNQALKECLPELMSRNIKKGQRLKSKIDVSFLLNNIELRNQSYLKKLVASSEKNLQIIKSGLELNKAMELSEEKLTPLNYQILDDFFLRKNNVIIGTKRHLGRKSEEESNLVIKSSLHIIKHFLNPGNKILEEPEDNSPKKKLMTKEELIEAEKLIYNKLKQEENNLNERVKKYLNRVYNIKLTAPRSDNKYDPKWLKINRDKNKDFYFYANNVSLNNKDIGMIHYKKLEPIPVRDKSCPNLKDINKKLFPGIKEGKTNRDEYLNIKNCNSVKILNDMQIIKRYKEKKILDKNEKDISGIKINNNKNDSYNTLNKIVVRNKSLLSMSRNRYQKLGSLIDIELPKLSDYDLMINKRKSLKYQTMNKKIDTNINDKIEKLNRIYHKWKLAPEINALKEEIKNIQTHKFDIEENYLKHKEEIENKTYMILNIPQRKISKNKSFKLTNNENKFNLNINSTNKNKHNININKNTISSYETPSLRMPSSYSVKILKRKSRINSSLHNIAKNKIYRENSNISGDRTNVSSIINSVRNSASISMTANKPEGRINELIKKLQKDDNKNKIKPVFSLKSMNLNFSTPNNNTSAISNISD